MAVAGLALLMALTDSCALGPPLPAYAHNDYENARPLIDALELGYQGAEVDFFLVGGELLVAHDRNRVRPEQTLEALYLRPLRDRIRGCGTVLPGRPFLLNLESKTPGDSAYAALRQLLSKYRDILTIVERGVERRGPVEIVLVGWHPPLDSLVQESERFVAVQWEISSRDAAPPVGPAHLVRLISLDFRGATSWSGVGSPPAGAVAVLARLEQARNAAAGRIARAYNVPPAPEVYHLLLESGVDLIGTKHLRRTARLLAH